METWKVIGVMSGTSLDGLDIALCEFSEDPLKWKLLKTEVIEYLPYWKTRIEKIYGETAYELAQLDAEYGSYIGTQVSQFCERNNIDIKTISLVASHGHTIFHQPKLGFTYQIGKGAYIAAKSRLTTVSDFRSLDIAKGGQGAPLVPIGDALLFSEYDACLNLGGFANISFKDRAQKRVAFDICPVNFVLNFYANKLGLEYDKNGENAKAGKIDEPTLNYLNNLSFYSIHYPKSLGREWVEENILVHLDELESIPDILSTFTEHVVCQIKQIVKQYELKSLFITGGGAYNKYLIEKLKQETTADIILPEDQIIKFKEALIFAFLGFLRFKNKTNTLSSVTGAYQDSISGSIYLP